MQSQLATATGTAGQPGQQAPASAPTLGQEPADPWPRIPALNAADHQLFMKHRDEEGNWKPGTPPQIIQKATEFDAACTEWSNRIIMDPKGALQPIIDYEVKKALQEALGGQPQEFFEKQYETRTQQETRQTEAATAWERVYPWMWQADPVTMQPSKLPTEFGSRFQASFAEAQQELKQLNPNLDDDSLFFHAMQSAYRRHEYELASLERQWQEYQAQQQAGGNGAGQAQAQGAQQAAQAQPAVDPRQQAQQEFLARNRRSNATGGQRTGAMPDNGQGGKTGPRTMGANAVGIDFVKGLAAEGFFQGVA